MISCFCFKVTRLLVTLVVLCVFHLLRFVGNKVLVPGGVWSSLGAGAIPDTPPALRGALKLPLVVRFARRPAHAGAGAVEKGNGGTLAETFVPRASGTMRRWFHSCQ